MVVSKEVAQQDVERWLSFKKLTDQRRDDKKENIEALINAVCDGNLVIDEDCNLIQKLMSPFGDEIKITELKYKPRLTPFALKFHLQGVKATDMDARVCAYVCALTSQAKGIIEKLDMEDYLIGQNVAFFFM